MKSGAGICKCPKSKNSLFMKLWDFETEEEKGSWQKSKKENWAENRGEIKKTKRDQTEEKQDKNEKMFRGDGRGRQTRVKKQRAEEQREGGGATAAVRKTGCGKMLRPGGLTRHDPAYETTAAPLHSTILCVRTRTCGCLCGPPPELTAGICVSGPERQRGTKWWFPHRLFSAFRRRD